MGRVSAADSHRVEVKARTSEYFSPTDAAIPETAAPVAP